MQSLEIWNKVTPRSYFKTESLGLNGERFNLIVQTRTLARSRILME